MGRRDSDLVVPRCQGCNLRHLPGRCALRVPEDNEQVRIDELRRQVGELLKQSDDYKAALAATEGFLENSKRREKSLNDERLKLRAALEQIKQRGDAAMGDNEPEPLWPDLVGIARAALKEES